MLLLPKYLCREYTICLFLNYELFNTIAIKNMNVMDVIKACMVCINFCFGNN